ncbi:MAG: methyltransferase domain-containing protein [Pseudomonadota bacterium]
MSTRLPTVVLTAMIVAAGAVAAAPPKADPAITAAVANPARSPESRARDQYRHPVQTLAFFGVKPTDSIVEFSPGGGWYTEILARAVANRGRYTALVGSPKAAEGANKLLTTKGLAGTVATLDTAAGTSTVAAGSATVVLTFRNIHNLTMNPNPAIAPNAFKAWYTMLKPGGTLGIVEHRLPAARDSADEAKSGYLKRATVVRLAEGAGFKLAGESEINANPKDTADYPDGVWTLPPVYQRKDVDRARYAAIGESDRMTLKFVKPKR